MDENSEMLDPMIEMDLARKENVLKHLKKAAIDSNSRDPVVSLRGYDTYRFTEKIARSLGVRQSDINNLSLPAIYENQRKTK